LIDDENIIDYEISYLRGCLGAIRNEPVIFKGTFRENIAYNKENVTDDQIAELFKNMNAN
jgi:ATP-binding cassette subfamily B multidrug efflux pump